MEAEDQACGYEITITSRPRETSMLFDFVLQYSSTIMRNKLPCHTVKSKINAPTSELHVSSEHH